MLMRTKGAMAVWGMAALLVIGAAGCGGNHRIIPGVPEVPTGQLPANAIFYTDSPTGEGIQVSYINPNGSGDTVYASLPATFTGFTFDPNTGQKFFGYMQPEATQIGIYRNSVASAQGATQIVSARYDFVSSMHVSPDGQTLYYVASIPEQPAQLWRVPIAGGEPVAIDTAEAADLTAAGDRLVYSKVVGAATELFVVGTGNGATPVQITSSGKEHLYPAWNRQGTEIAFASDASDSSLDLFKVDASGDNEVQLTNTLGVTELSPSFNEAGSRVAFVALSSNVEESGLYTTGANGTDVGRQLVKADQAILEWTYWTTSEGRSRSPKSILQLIRSRR